MSEVIKATGAEAALLQTGWEPGAPANDTGALHYSIGWVGDRPVCTAATIVHAGVNLVEWVSTSPDVRGKGGRIIRIGEVELDARQPCARCTMVTRPQPGLERDLGIYRTLARHHGGNLGVWTTVRVPGMIRAADNVDVIDRSEAT